MNEQEYINATNLAKIRIASDIIRDLLYDEGSEFDKAQKCIVEQLAAMCRSAEADVEGMGDQ